MARARLYRRPDGGVSIVVPVEGDYETAVTKGISSAWVSLGDVDATTLPSREFRDCWRHDGQKIVVDVLLETAVRWVRIRRERDTRLAASDGLMARANETGAKVQEWKAYRQALRDLPHAQRDPKRMVWPVPPS